MGRPTDAYPYPTEYLNGYDIKLKKRKPPLKRISIIKKKKYVADYQKLIFKKKDFLVSETNDVEDLQIFINTPKRLLKRPLLLKHRKRLLSKFSLKLQAKFSWDRVCHSDRLIKFSIGCTKKVFMFLISKEEKYYDKLCYYKGKLSQIFKLKQKKLEKPGRKSTITIQNEILLMCIKLQLDLAIQDLTFRFSISQSHCSRILTTWITYFGNKLKRLLLWPTREANLLYKARHFPGKLHNVEGIIDCTEQKIQRPSNAKAQYQVSSCMVF
ncbi:uncharacterized protein LOC136078476 [Hydra vulgaris]|uniref:Uncharacterized protein LOC136078476 n=1 Tax=Hydra vulgaris TaxID=6087 RepID=A0ABM4BML3_HYDVU